MVFDRLGSNPRGVDVFFGFFFWVVLGCFGSFWVVLGRFGWFGLLLPLLE
jgi:hypothetical protein